MAKFKDKLIVLKKKIIEKRKYVSLGGMFLAIILFLLFFNSKFKKLENEKNRYKVELDLIKTKSESWRDEIGYYRIQTENINAGINDLKIVYEDELKKLRRDFSSINRNYSNLLSVMNLSSETIDTIRTKLNDIEIPDNLTPDQIYPIKSFNYKDRWSTINGKIYNQNDIVLDYKINDSITFITTYTQKKFLKFIPYGETKIKLEGISHNPNTMLKGLKNITIDENSQNRKNAVKITFGPQVGFGVTRFGLTPYAGVGFGIKFR